MGSVRRRVEILEVENFGDHVYFLCFDQRLFRASLNISL